MTRITLATIRDYLAHRAPLRISEPDTIEAAVALVLTTVSAAGAEVLLIKRAEDERDPWSGQIALPGGRREPQDRDLLETASREAFEETGIELSIPNLLGELDDLHPRTPVLPPVVVRPFVFGLLERPAVRPNAEVTLHLWVSLSELKNRVTRSRILVRGKSREVTGYQVGPHLVWGMTERILKPLIELSA